MSHPQGGAKFITKFGCILMIKSDHQRLCVVHVSCVSVPSWCAVSLQKSERFTLVVKYHIDPYDSQNKITGTRKKCFTFR